MASSHQPEETRLAQPSQHTCLLSLSPKKGAIQMSAIPHAEPPRHEPPIPRRRILIVDDDAYVREVIAQYLQLEGYEVIQAANGLQALTLASEHPPDLVVLDLILPGMDGFEVASRLRAVSAVPILMLTGRADEADKLAGFGVSADDYMTKPFWPPGFGMRLPAMKPRRRATDEPSHVNHDGPA